MGKNEEVKNETVWKVLYSRLVLNTLYESVSV